MKARIALIIPYFGPLPVWFPYFLKSVSYSSILDVLIFTDAQPRLPMPENVRIIPFSITEFCALASRVLSLPISINFSFKLCDFKPAFGEIFHEYIHSYEFWAFGDMDLVFGDAKSFLDPLLDHYDVISCRKGWISGSFCVLRNCKDVNRLFARSADWQSAFQAPDYQMFDELGGFLYANVLEGASLSSLKSQVESFTHTILRSSEDGTLKCAFFDLACEEIPWGQTLTFDSGRVTTSTNGSSVMYVHFVCMKRRFFEGPKVTAAPDRFFVRKTGIYLQRPDWSTLFSEEARRVLRGSINGMGRLLRRYIP